MNYTKQQIVDELNNFGLNFKTEYVNFDDPRDYRVDFTKLNNTIDYKIEYNLKEGIQQILNHLSK